MSSPRRLTRILWKVNDPHSAGVIAFENACGLRPSGPGPR